MSARIPLSKIRGPRAGEVIAYALVDESDVADLGRYRWHLEGQGYAARYGSPHGRRIYMHREILGLVSGDSRLGDHVNRDKLDNRRSNLRILTRSQSAQNVSAQRRARSQFRGVGWNAARNKWDASVTFEGKRHFLGRFVTEEEAAEVVSAWRAEHMPFAVEGAAA